MKPRIFSDTAPEEKFNKLTQLGNIKKGDKVKIVGHGTFLFHGYVEYKGAAWVDVVDPDTKALRSFSLDKVREVKHGRGHTASDVTLRKGQ